MVNQATFLDRLEDWLRERGGMLRRRSAAATIARMSVAASVLGLLGASAIATGDATALLVGIVLLLGIRSASRRLR